MALPRGERETCENNELAVDLGQVGCIEFQSVSAARPKQRFERLEHTIYEGRRRLGRCEQIAVSLFVAFDAQDRPLGEFSRHHDAYAAVFAIPGGAQ